jgi:hypothetical protein
MRQEGASENGNIDTRGSSIETFIIRLSANFQLQIHMPRAGCGSESTIAGLHTISHPSPLLLSGDDKQSLQLVLIESLQHLE